MTHITLSIPDEIYKEMKKHKEINWSEVARKSIVGKINMRKDTITSEDLLKLLPENTLENLKKIDKKKAREFYKKMEEEEWKRLKSLTQNS